MGFFRLWICGHKPFFGLWTQMRKRMETAQKLRELEELQKVVENIPKEIPDTYTNHQNLRKEQEIAYE